MKSIIDAEECVGVKACGGERWPLTYAFSVAAGIWQPIMARYYIMETLS